MSRETVPHSQVSREGTPNSEDTYKLPCTRFHNRWYGNSDATIKYPFPIDSEECNRIDIWHKVFLVAQDEMEYLQYALPRDREHKVLDLGAGTGIWAFSVVETYHEVDVLAVDFNGIQPKLIPHRVSISSLDIEDPSWDLPRDYSLAHLRLLYGSIETTLWPAIYRNAYKHLTPETGWIEHSEIDFTPHWEPDSDIPNPSYLQQWCREYLDGLEETGRSGRVDSARTKRQLEEAGFVDIEEDTIRCCVSPWSQDTKAHELGRWTNLVLACGFDAMSLRPMCGDEHREGRMSYDAARELWMNAKTEICALRYHAYLTMHTWRGRKPRSA